jgi:hypothetical protein
MCTGPARLRRGDRRRPEPRQSGRGGPDSRRSGTAHARRCRIETDQLWLRRRCFTRGRQGRRSARARHQSTGSDRCCRRTGRTGVPGVVGVRGVAGVPGVVGVVGVRGVPGAVGAARLRASTSLNPAIPMFGTPSIRVLLNRARIGVTECSSRVSVQNHPPVSGRQARSRRSARGSWLRPAPAHWPRTGRAPRRCPRLPHRPPPEC